MVRIRYQRSTVVALLGIVLGAALVAMQARSLYGIRENNLRYDGCVWTDVASDRRVRHTVHFDGGDWNYVRDEVSGKVTEEVWYRGSLNRVSFGLIGDKPSRFLRHEDGTFEEIDGCDAFDYEDCHDKRRPVKAIPDDHWNTIRLGRAATAPTSKNSQPRRCHDPSDRIPTQALSTRAF